MFAQRAAEPELGKIPIAQNRFLGDPEHFGNFLCVKTAEKFQLHNLALAGVIFREGLQRPVELDKIDLAFGRQLARFLQGELLLESAAFGRVMDASMIDQNLAHHPRGDPIKAGSIFPGKPGLIGQSEVSFVHKRGRLQSVIAPFAGEMSARLSPQLFINEWHQSFRRVWIPGAPILQDQGDIVRGSHWGGCRSSIVDFSRFPRPDQPFTTPSKSFWIDVRFRLEFFALLIGGKI
jgi:hypothetical protein